MATQTSSAGKLAKLSARKQKYAELSKSLTVDLPDRQTNSEEKLPALSSERENLSTPQTNSFSGDSELQQEKRYWLSRVEEDQEQLKALLVVRCNILFAFPRTTLTDPILPI